MKRLLTLFAILATLAAAAYFLKPSESGEKTSLSTKDRDFAFPKDDIGKFTITEPGKEPLTFTRQKGGVWLINDKYKASQFVMPNLLAPLSKITIQNIPSKKESETIRKNMDRIGIQIKVYDLQGQEVRSYRIGLESQDQTGTAYIMDGSGQPYNMYLKAFEGDVRLRFSQPLDRYRDRGIFRYQPEDIQEISVKFHKDQKSSFKMVIKGGDAEVTPLSSYISPSENPVNKNYVKAYLGAFNRVYAENFDNENIRRDSLEALVPYATVRVVDTQGNVNEADFLPLRDIVMRNVNTRNSEDARKVERYFVIHKHEGLRDFILAQHRNVKGVFRPYDYFFQK